MLQAHNETCCSKIDGNVEFCFSSLYSSLLHMHKKQLCQEDLVWFSQPRIVTEEALPKCAFES